MHFVTPSSSVTVAFVYSAPSPDVGCHVDKVPLIDALQLDKTCLAPANLQPHISTLLVLDSVDRPQCQPFQRSASSPSVGGFFFQLPAPSAPPHLPRTCGEICAVDVLATSSQVATVLAARLNYDRAEYRDNIPKGQFSSLSPSNFFVISTPVHCNQHVFLSISLTKRLPIHSSKAADVHT